MNYSPDKPAIFDKLKIHFPHLEETWEKGIAITYGDTVYCKHRLPPDVQAHEEIHVMQQERIGKDAYVEKYLTNPHFRFLMEAEAYKYQVIFLRNFVKDRNKLFKLIHKLALDLSGPVYNNICTYDEAMKAIK